MSWLWCVECITLHSFGGLVELNENNTIELSELNLTNKFYYKDFTFVLLKKKEKKPSMTKNQN